jgi:hypothetical protein
MDLTPGELPDEPRIDRSERELAGFGARSQPVDLFQVPDDLRCGEVWV